MLKVRVGKDLKLSTFIVHQDLLTERFEFFRRVTAGVWQQVHDEHLVTLPDDDEHIFRLYFNLVYAGQLGTRGADEWTKLSRLFVLAEKLVDLTAKNQIVDGMHAFFNELVKKNPTGLQVERILPAAATKQLYEGTPRNGAKRGSSSWTSTPVPQTKVGYVTVRVYYPKSSSMMLPFVCCRSDPRCSILQSVVGRHRPITISTCRTSHRHKPWLRSLQRNRTQGRNPQR
jgi:hypothetical protein